jgi:hypothetical protein
MARLFNHYLPQLLRSALISKNDQVFPEKPRNRPVNPQAPGIFWNIAIARRTANQNPETTFLCYSIQIKSFGSYAYGMRFIHIIPAKAVKQRGEIKCMYVLPELVSRNVLHIKSS